MSVQLRVGGRGGIEPPTFRFSGGVVGSSARSNSPCPCTSRWPAAALSCLHLRLVVRGPYMLDISRTTATQAVAGAGPAPPGLASYLSYGDRDAEHGLILCHVSGTQYACNMKEPQKPNLTCRNTGAR